MDWFFELLAVFGVMGGIYMFLNRETRRVEITASVDDNISTKVVTPSPVVPTLKVAQPTTINTAEIEPVKKRGRAKKITVATVDAETKKTAVVKPPKKPKMVRVK